MTDTAASIDVTSFRATHDGDESWRVHVECREDMSAHMKQAGIKDIGFEHDTVLILLGIDGEPMDVIATDDPNWPTGIGRARNGLYEQLVDARRALNIAISAMEIKS
ncbi:MAG: hypothetical protein P1U38_09740 [Aeromicrobium sp.]|uniref:hypothetical protein n=1 Tax=Aeromicrobium sp. TaxID=1871063 RepID=UPI0026359245|nr:hypothetical protein [Aeromicrobium sp.]MDF1705043.1 hypothetical protein [Aeromicrobium sp.]